MRCRGVVMVTVAVMLDRIAAWMQRMRTEQRDQAGEDGPQQWQKDNGLDHSPVPLRTNLLLQIMRLALHQIDVFDRDRAAVAEIHHQHGKSDCSLGRRHRQHQQCEHLADDVAKEGRERHQVDVDREQDQLDRHQDDDDVLAVEKNAEDAEREQHRGDGEIMSKTDRHCTHSGASASCRPWPEATLRRLIASSGVRAFCTLMSCRLTLALWRSVSTMAPIIATKSTMPAI